MAARVGSSGEGVFSTAISQAPVTDWRYYGEQNCNSTTVALGKSSYIQCL